MLKSPARGDDSFEHAISDHQSCCRRRGESGARLVWGATGVDVNIICAGGYRWVVNDDDPAGKPGDNGA
jgi:hypothetical protein